MAKRSENTGKARLVRISAALLAALAATPEPAAAQTLSCGLSLAFADYTTCGASGSATVTPAGSRSISGCLTGSTGVYHNGQCFYFVAGTPPQIQISVTATKYTMKNSTGAKMVVDSFSCYFQGASTPVTGPCQHTTQPSTLIMNIGATLNVSNPQAEGSYSGAFTVNFITF